MTAWNIIVAAFDGARARAVAMRQHLRDAWTSRTAVELTLLAAEDLETGNLDAFDAAVLVVPVAGAERLTGPLIALEEAGIATLLLVDAVPEDASRYEFAGALVQPVDVGAASLCAKLEGMMHRQAELKRLRREVALAHRFHGGLRGEIARIHEELQLAAMVQREFLPRELPRLCGIEFAALWRPAHYVSGDIYDVSRLDDDHVGVFIADAVGHGVPAALMTMVICRSLKTKVISGSHYRIIEPSEVLHRLNRDMIRRQGATTRFATGAYGVVNCRSRVMRFAGAGHPPPLLHGADGSVRELETPGGLLGVFEDERYDQIEVELGVGDRLLLYSDGFEQAFPALDAGTYERRLPTSRYREEFEALVRAKTPSEMISAIGHRLDDQQGSLHQVDDLTLLCMHAGALDAAAPPETPAPGLRGATSSVSALDAPRAASPNS